MSDNQKLVIVLLLIAVGALLAGCAGQARTVKSGDNVSVDYTGWFENGTIFDSSNATVALENGLYTPARTYEPMSFVVNDPDTMIIRGFQNATLGMKVGETKNVTLLPADAYGAYNLSLVTPVNMSDLLSADIQPEVNMTLYTWWGQEVRVDRIDVNRTDYNSSLVYIDYNSPMAGKTLNFMITLRGFNA